MSLTAEAPFDNFSMARGLMGFARDLRKYPREMCEAADGLVDGCVLSACQDHVRALRVSGA